LTAWSAATEYDEVSSVRVQALYASARVVPVAASAAATDAIAVAPGAPASPCAKTLVRKLAPYFSARYSKKGVL
jgi:hypothetical protein